MGRAISSETEVGSCVTNTKISSALTLITYKLLNTSMKLSD